MIGQVDTHCFGGYLVFADAFEGATVRRELEAAEKPEHQQKHREGPPDVASIAGYALDAQGSVGEGGHLGGVGKQADYLAKAEGDDGQIVTLEA